MCNGGRIKHHLVRNITRPESTILFVGYQAEGTLGRQILDGEPNVRILGQNYPVSAHIDEINGFSSHADQEHLLKWLRGFLNPPRKLFITHGEKEATSFLTNLIEKQFGWLVTAPDYKETFLLD
jgi:metallo-beta-lactamase family protein